jgi:hypothetical protein
MKLNVKLPVRIVVDDYHEFVVYKDALRCVIPRIQVTEIGAVGGKYMGVAYVGRRHAPAVVKIVQQIHDEEQEAEEFSDALNRMRSHG